MQIKPRCVKIVPTQSPAWRSTCQCMMTVGVSSYCPSRLSSGSSGRLALRIKANYGRLARLKARLIKAPMHGVHLWSCEVVRSMKGNNYDRMHVRVSSTASFTWHMKGKWLAGAWTGHLCRRHVEFTSIDTTSVTKSHTIHPCNHASKCSHACMQCICHAKSCMHARLPR
jgi:hypothetical protein